MIKEVIVMRKDLKMRKGKMIAQGGHSVDSIWKSRIDPTPRVINGETVYLISLTEDILKDMTFSTKITVSVNSEEELQTIYEQAKEAGLPVHMVTDAGKTEFNGVPTNTCLSIGPAQAEKIDVITGHLPLL